MLLFHVILAVLTSAHLALLAPGDEQFKQFVCTSQACYSVFWSSRRYERAKRDCENIQGHLMTVKTSLQAGIISNFLSSMKREHFRLWIGLEPKNGCTDLSKPLRGFTWPIGDISTSNINWIDDVQKCGTFCVTIHKNGSWEELECQSKADGFLCEVPNSASCLPLQMPSGYNVTYVHDVLGIGFINGPATIPIKTYTSNFQRTLICEEKSNDRVEWSSTTPGAWPCLIENGGCEHECEEENGEARCKCHHGLQLSEDHRSCSDVCNPKPCDQICVLKEEPPGFRCMCSTGYHIADDGVTCIDVDECEGDPNICDHQCKNTMGSYECVCKPGFRKAETNCSNPQNCECQDIDECEGLVCEQLCANFPGNYSCSCNDGFVIDTNNPKKCKKLCNAAMCEAECDGKKCRCPEGYVLEENEDNESKCVDVDECEANPCEWTCSNLFGSYECICPEGFTDQEGTCIPPDVWAQQPTAETPMMPTQDPSPLSTSGIDATIWFGIGIAIISMLIALMTMLCRIRRKHYMFELNLDYKVKDTEKDVILQQVKTVPQWRL